MPCDLLIVGLQCQQSKADRQHISKNYDNFDISIFLAKSMYQRIEASSTTTGRLVGKEGLIASRSQE